MSRAVDTPLDRPTAPRRGRDVGAMSSAGLCVPANARPVFEHVVRVYWEDTDAGGVVFYANYLKYFERARTEWLRSLGFSQETLRTEDAAMFVVASTNIRYLRPARLDDALRVSVVVLEAGRATLAIAQQAHRGDELVAEGDIRIGCVDAGTFRPRRIPTDLLTAIA